MFSRRPLTAFCVHGCRIGSWHLKCWWRSKCRTGDCQHRRRHNVRHHLHKVVRHHLHKVVVQHKSFSQVLKSPNLPAAPCCSLVRQSRLTARTLHTTVSSRRVIDLIPGSARIYLFVIHLQLQWRVGVHVRRLGLHRPATPLLCNLPWLRLLLRLRRHLRLHCSGC